MSKKLCISKRIKGVSGRVDYYLVESRCEDIKNGILTFVFGVEIHKITTDGQGVEYIQKNSVHDLSAEREKVLEFLYMLADNDVLPAGLCDIVRDFAEDGFFCKSDEEKKLA